MLNISISSIYCLKTITHPSLLYYYIFIYLIYKDTFFNSIDSTHNGIGDSRKLSLFLRHIRVTAPRLRLHK